MSYSAGVQLEKALNRDALIRDVRKTLSSYGLDLAKPVREIKTTPIRRVDDFRFDSRVDRDVVNDFGRKRQLSFEEATRKAGLVRRTVTAAPKIDYGKTLRGDFSSAPSPRGGGVRGEGTSPRSSKLRLDDRLVDERLDRKPDRSDVSLRSPPTCKERPVGVSRRAGGGASRVDFIPWCDDGGRRKRH